MTDLDPKLVAQVKIWEKWMAIGLVACGCATLLLGLLLCLTIICLPQGALVMLGSFVAILCGLRAIGCARREV